VRTVRVMDSIVEKRVRTLLPLLDEKQKRIYLATEAEGLGYGGLKALHELTGVSPTTIIRGKKELRGGAVEHSRVRRRGGGRKAIAQKYGRIREEIEKIIGGGGPEKVIIWTTKSLKEIGEALRGKGFDISRSTVSSVLKETGYSLGRSFRQNQQAGAGYPDRDAQFEYIERKGGEFVRQGQPVISVEAGRKEPGGVTGYGFPVGGPGKAAPCGVYGASRDEGFVDLGVLPDAAGAAGESVLRWWQALGRSAYPQASKIYIAGAGVGGPGTGLWEKQMQGFADLTGLEVHVSYFPPGTTKWNRVEHRMYCFTSRDRGGKPLMSVETVIELISNEAAPWRPEIVCVKGGDGYRPGAGIGGEGLAGLNITRDGFRGDWNYVIAPRAGSGICSGWTAGTTGIP
jgi:transposase